MNYVYYDYICACTIDAAARAGVYHMHIHIDLSIYTGIWNRMYMHACMQGTRSCMRALRNVNRARPLISTAGDARVHRKSHLYVHIYIYTYTGTYMWERARMHDREREREREREMHARRACVNAWIDACMRAHACLVTCRVHTGCNIVRRAYIAIWVGCFGCGPCRTCVGVGGHSKVMQKNTNSQYADDHASNCWFLPLSRGANCSRL